jgi:hypothetical protein
LGYSACLGPGHAAGIGARQLTPDRCLIDIGGENLFGLQTKLSEKLKAAGTGGGQNQAAVSKCSYYYLNRKVMRPLVRS